MKNRCRGPLDLISNVILSIFVFEWQYSEFHGFSILGAPWKTINPPKLIPIITLKLCIDKTTSKVGFVSKNDVSSPLKLHPKSLKIELGSPRRPSWRSEGPAEFFKAPPGSQKVTPNVFQALPIQQKRTQNHKSRVPVTFKGHNYLQGAGGKGRSRQV